MPIEHADAFLNSTGLTTRQSIQVGCRYRNMRSKENKKEKYMYAERENDTDETHIELQALAAATLKSGNT